MTNQNYNRYDHAATRIGVIYKEDAQALEMFVKTLYETPFRTHKEIEWSTLGAGKRLHRVIIRNDYSTCNSLPESGKCVSDTIYSFHKMTQERDVHNVAGMHFRGFYFCDTFSAHTLNYLMSRVRG